MNQRGCPEEYPIVLRLNGHEVAVFQLTNSDLEDWAYGYLYSEGMIDSTADVERIVVAEDRSRIDVHLLTTFDVEKFFNKKAHYTAGCGRGVTFFSMTDVKQFRKIQSIRQAKLSFLLKKQGQFAQNSPLYLETGGMHGACIVFPDGEMVVREDIGRHNAVDKIIGYALRNQLSAEDLILLTTGRISYEMLSKCAKFGVGIVGSRTAATKQAIQLANVLQIEVVGYLRGKRAIVYTSMQRVQDDICRTTND